MTADNIRKTGFGMHGLFLLGLLAAYLYTLFLVAQLSDVADLGHDAVRVIAALVELGALGLVMAYPLRRWGQRRRIAWFVVYLLLAVLLSVVYLAQIYSLYLSNNFISVLGLQNVRYAGLTRSAIEAVIFAAGAVWLLLLGVFTWRFPERSGGTGGARGVVLTFVVLALLYAWVFTLQRQRVTLEPDFRQVPLASLAVNASLAFGGASTAGAPIPGAAKTVLGTGCFRDPGAGHVVGYPFQKSTVYQPPLPYPATTDAPKRPNVIVIFTEGLSARMVGAYGGHYSGLTPHIDGLARHAMRVTDYYNHTAATFRGIIGQNSSGYAYNGGGGRDGWVHGNNAEKLATIRRQTLADILHAHGYETVFFDPHSGTAFPKMIHSLGFRQRYGFKRISKLLDGHIVIQDKTHQVDDGTLFRGLVTWLRQRHARGDQKPFYLGLYNIGTHTFIPMVSGGHAYKRGSNAYLDKVHNYDAALGQFLTYFRSSPYARDTILVFTTDHATYPDRVYRDVAGEDLKPYFVDEIPLLIRDPTHQLPATLDAHGRNSLDLAPTVLQLLGIRRAPNSFLGASLFAPRSFRVGLSAIGTQYYVTSAQGVSPIWAAPQAQKQTAQCERSVVEKYYQLEAVNHLFTTRPSGNSQSSNAPVFAFKAPAHAPRKAPGKGHVLCALDSVDGKTIVHDGTDTSVPPGKRFVTKGWFVNAAHHGVTHVRLVLTPLHGGDAHLFVATKTRMPRPDVARALQNLGATQSGFRVWGSAQGLPAGRYRVTARSGKGRTQLTCDFHVTFDVPGP